MKKIILFLSLITTFSEVSLQATAAKIVSIILNNPCKAQKIINSIKFPILERYHHAPSHELKKLFPSEVEVCLHLTIIDQNLKIISELKKDPSTLNTNPYFFTHFKKSLVEIERNLYCLEKGFLDIFIEAIKYYDTQVDSSGIWFSYALLGLNNPSKASIKKGWVSLFDTIKRSKKGGNNSSHTC